MPISFSPPPSRDARARGAGVTAVLGPTNTGKTHLAIERMLAHSSGIIGLPLRLLAREVYNKVVERVGASEVALITGEEKIKPPNPRFWVSTVEAMPRDLDVAFLAVDEIQLGADFERGHVFTDRMLHRRAREETLVLGAATMRPLVEKLLPGAHILTRPRLSQLTFAGEKKITRLPRRSAIVAFSADEVYAIAELIRRQRGGAAVVLGALSPRTRNAQVALYQAGDVEYLVATDAIGMGLNLDVDHIAFASDRKFDGYQFRKLNPAELAQIAGRAGRATRDGTFGTTGRCPPFDEELVRALETHSFEPVRVLQWRNAALDFASIGALQSSLAETPQEQGLTRAPIGEDIQVLEHAARDEGVRATARTREAVERLWEVCQVPDYRKIAPATHAELVVTLYGFLSREGRISVDWFARQVAQADRIDGDIDTLSNRIAHVRTWTFVANRPDWLDDPEHWQDVTRAVEDKLSDALHERLTARFVDRRTSVLMRRLREKDMLETNIDKSGEVVVEGHPIGRLDGFMFAPDASAAGPEAKALQAAAQKALAGEIDARAARLSQAPDDHFVLASDGVIRWLGQPVGKLAAAEEVLKPRVRILADEQLTGASRDVVQSRLDLWIKTHIEKLLAPLFQVEAAQDISGIARGVAYQFIEALGVLERQKVSEEVKSLDQPARAALRKYGVRFGAFHVYAPALLKPAPRTLALHLWSLKQGDADGKAYETVQSLAASGRTSIAADAAVQPALYRMAGYRVCGERAVRVDILERLADLIRPALAWRENAPGMKPPGAVDGRGFTVTGAMTSLTGTSGEGFASILRSLGYRMERRPKPPEVAEMPAQAAAPEPAIAREAEAADPAAAGIAPVSEVAEVEAPENEAAPPLVEGAAEGVPESEVPPAEVAVAEDVPVTEPVASAEPDADVEAGLAETLSPAAAGIAPVAEAPVDENSGSEAAASASVEPEMIEVWRPGRPEGQRQRHRRPERRPERRVPPQAAQAADTLLPAGDEAAAANGKPERGKFRRPDQKSRRDERSQRQGRPERGRGGRPDREEGARTYTPREDRRERREKAPDPNSPFAKLAALKAQLEAKDRR